MNLRIALAFCKIHASYIDFGLSHASRIIPLSPAKAYYEVAVDQAEFVTWIWRSSFFSPFKKKKSNDVVRLFFTLNDSFNLKDEHSNSIEKNRNKNWDIFFIVYCAFCQSKYVNTYFLTPQCLIYPGLPFQAVTGKWGMLVCRIGVSMVDLFPTLS